MIQRHLTSLAINKPKMPIESMTTELAPVATDRPYRSQAAMSRFLSESTHETFWNPMAIHQAEDRQKARDKARRGGTGLN
jgi:hypothetical protein